MEPTARALLGEPNARLSKPPRELRWGNKGSLSVDLQNGRWFDHERNVGGVVLDFIQDRVGGDRVGAVLWLIDGPAASKPTPVKSAEPVQAPAPEIVKQYDYTDESGTLLFQAVRYEPKTFKQRRPDGGGGWIWDLDNTRRVPYRLPDLVAALQRGDTIYVCEGEKDADNLRDLGLAATTNPGGANKWRSEYSEFLRGADLVIIGDNDQPGRDHTKQVAQNLTGLAKRVRVLDLSKHWPQCPEGGDISDWLAAGGDTKELEAWIESAPEFKPPETEHTAPQPSLHNWDDPDVSLLDDRRGELPEIPMDVFPTAWQEWLKRAAHGAGVRPEHVAIPLLGIASSLIGTARRVRASRSWSEPMTLWTCVVADSGDRKTPGLRVTIRALDLIEKNNAPDNSAKRLAHETKVQQAKEISKKWKEEREAALKETPPREPPVMPMDAIDPGNFIEPRLYATDPTIERLAPLLQARPRGMMLIRDELSGLFANMARYSGGSDRPFWLEAFNGGRHVVERVSGSVVVDHLLIGIIGTFQPDKLARAFSGDEDGMYGRFLYVWPLAPEYRPLSNEASEVEPELVNALTALIRLPSEAESGLFAEQSAWLSDEAIAEFETFREWSDKTKHGLDGRERHWFAKGETHVLRLAGVLAYMAWAIALGTGPASGLDGITGSLEPQTIDKKSMADAIRLWREFFWPHARAALRQIGLSDRHKHARRALKWLRTHPEIEAVSVKDVRRDALAQSLDAKDTEALLHSLVAAGWLKPKPVEQTGGRPIHRWAPNPILYGSAESAVSAESPS
jgi:Protein of unknown function (DUF3987)